MDKPASGHPGKVRFHHGHLQGSRYVNIMAQNPKFVDGTWATGEWGRPDGSGFLRSTEQGEMLGELFEGYAKSLGMAGLAGFLP